VKRILSISLVAMIVATTVWLGISASRPNEPSFSKYAPQGALLYLEAKDLSSLLAQWDASPQKRKWIEGSNYDVFSRSRLLLRLKAAGDQFGATAGFPPDVNFMRQIAGSHSALVLYDIGNLQFLYITTLPAAKSAQTLLWQTRAKFESRTVEGKTFYVRRDPDGKREVAFAVSGDQMLLATREDLIAGALQLMAGSKIPALDEEGWWGSAVKSAAAAGDLRIVLNLEKIVPSPYFRSYWVQQNITELKGYNSAVSDLYRSGAEFREERVLIHKTPSPSLSTSSATPADEEEPRAQSGSATIGQLARLAPEDAGLFKTEANPSVDACIALLRDKLLDPTPAHLSFSKTAPQVPAASSDVGSTSDFETRIDQAVPEVVSATFEATALRRLLEKNSVASSLLVQSTGVIQSGVFVETHSAVALTGTSDWNIDTVESAIADSIRPQLTASELGLVWIARSGYKQVDGLLPLFVSTRGPILIVANDETLMQQLLSNAARGSQENAAMLIAGFRHAKERTNFDSLFRVIDRPHGISDQGSTSQSPQFFSNNISSLSTTLADLADVKVNVRSDGDKLRQTVTYTWSR